ncbi:MAG TPA: HAD family hydrolase [Blastocatellia bacterium]|nr:HAD family hydrolase [Blastocatellia bacterium]
MIKSINALLFDWDGTLFDSATTGFAAFKRTFEDLGVSFTLDFYEGNYSPNWYRMYEALDLPRDDWKRADELWLEHYGEQPARMVEDAYETIIELDSRGYRLGVVTSGSQKRVTREIHELGLASTFGVVICNESIINKKPHPEGLEKAIAGMNSSPENCCYVGDAPEDIQMGKNARVLTVAVLSAYPTSKRLREADPDIHLESIGDLLVYF